MYTQLGKNIQEKTVKKALEAYIETTVKRHYPRNYRKIKNSTSFDLSSAAKELHQLNKALYRGGREKNRKYGQVWAECTKAPKNLDSGCHYYDVFYIDDKGNKCKFWAHEFMLALGAVEWNRDYTQSKWVWRSSAIGMSRLLDATDGIFRFLRRIGGHYAQL